MNSLLIHPDIVFRRKYAEATIFPVIVFVFALCSTISAQTWEQTNGPYGGLIKSMAVSSNGYISAATYNYGGIFRSIDNGNNWTHIGLANHGW
ncbi:MAG: hypothetical protein V3V99_03280 [candidate division Zixibacteria bacterium]